VPDRQPDHYVFPSEQVGQGGAYLREPHRPIGSWKTAWARAKKRAGVTARFHDIRHTVCTRMLEGGVPLSVVATLLGWSPATTALMARRYGHIGDSARRSAVTVLNDVSAKAGERGHKIGHSDVPVETIEPVGH
jgi:integrase